MRALIVEDESTTRLLLKRLLTRFFPDGVLEARDGEEGLALIEREHPVVVFCDLQMPKLDGVELIEQLRARPEFADLPVIAISATKDKDLILKLIGLGVADYLLKPIDFEATHKRLARLLPTLIPAPHGGAVESSSS